MKGNQIVMASSFTYKGPIKVGIHQYADLFARFGWRVFFLSSQLSPLHIIRKKDRIHSKEKIRLWSKGGEWQNGILSYSYLTMFPILPFFASEFLIKSSLDLTFPKLSKVINRNGFDNVDALWIENPHLVDLPSKIKHNILIYRIADEIKGFEGFSPFILRKHQDGLRSANLIITTARKLYDKYEEMDLDGRVVYVPNGVDFGHFNRTQLSVPDEYRNIPSPRVLYVGLISSWFDQDLVVRCAERLKNVSFVVIGPAMVDISRMASVENIHVLGARRYDDLPAYLADADVGIIPFKINKLVDSINPVKLYEYMAAGLPVVCTDWKEMREMQSPAMLARDTDVFCEYIESCLEIKDKTEIISYARKNSWENRFNKIMHEVETCLGK